MYENPHKSFRHKGCLALSGGGKGLSIYTLAVGFWQTCLIQFLFHLPRGSKMTRSLEIRGMRTQWNEQALFDTIETGWTCGFIKSHSNKLEKG